MREKRQHRRAVFTVPVKIVAQGVICEVESLDISLGGMFLKGETSVAIGTELTLCFSLPKLGEVHIPGFMRWVTPDGFGVQFGLIGARETHAVGLLIRAA